MPHCEWIPKLFFQNRLTVVVVGTWATMKSFFSIQRAWPRYTLLHAGYQDEGHNSDESGHDGIHKPPLLGRCNECGRLGYVQSTCWFWFNLSLLLTSIIVLITALKLAADSQSLTTRHSPRNSLLRQISMPSPVLDEIDIPIVPKKMDATLLKSEPPSIFRGDPSPEVDAAWRRISDTRPIALTRDDVLAAGKDPASAVQIPTSWGLGEDKYFGRLDVLHQIHCLDAIRMEAHFEHYYGRKYANGYNDTSRMHRLHLSHCLWLVLQNIMCAATTDVYTHFWTDTFEHAFPDFGVAHQYRDFEAVLRW
ncbi:hypothetical protein EJ03DRAFT_21764 [Teratosphaeria nubilosa]|uniref:Uncharacterized protein n=1 Tax=Teratosphaeria nubilosa TaxID=161662 RepID=A0A6G1LGG8_9PEZI|nr:hypothetical protein EJ03DRAFT_21764 [Teratosphaeria nubilosa]